MEYSCVEYDEWTKVHVLVVDPDVYEIRSVFSKKPVLNTVKKHDAVAGVNGGFWKTDRSPAGILKCDGVWHGFPGKPRGSIGWTKDGKTVLIDQLLTEEVEGEVIVCPRYTDADAWNNLDHIVGGAPVLVRDGEMVEDFSSERTIETFLTKKHSRTAIGIRSNGDWVFVLVNGYISMKKSGMTMPELAQYMVDLDCLEAVNLDGGSSSTMVVDDLIVSSWNLPVSDAIIIIKKEGQ